MSQKLSVPHPRKKIDKTTLIVLCVIGIVIAAILAARFNKRFKNVEMQKPM